jgi:glycosyltransferase involved in cell wall biosynthesis
MTLVAEYDLAHPPQMIWGVEGHNDAIVLICRAGRPLQVVELELDPGSGALTRERIEQAIGLESVAALHAQKVGMRSCPATRPPFTVAVCTRERPCSLERCLAALRRLDYPHFEVVVVDNASRDEATREVVAQAGSLFRYVREQTPGLNWARNRAVAEAGHDLIAFCDDDAQASPGWLAAIADALADPQVAAVTGLVLPMELVTRAQRLFEQYGHGMCKGFVPHRFHGPSLTAHQLIQAQAVGVGANMAFRRGTFDAIGGFDTALDVGTPALGGGDLDFFHRILAAGLTIQYEPAAWMRHQHRRDYDALRQQLYANGVAFGVYLQKIARSGRFSTAEVRKYAMCWGKWLIGRSAKSCLRKGRLPRALVWAELAGAIRSIGAYRATLREDQRCRALRQAA